jgi:hypothetical protein
MTSEALVNVTLHELAHARTGDKGDRANISLVPYDPAAWAFLRDEITAERVRAWFTHRGVGKVVRYDLPKIQAFNFVLDGVLQGGVNGSLNLDGHGKSLSFHLLAMPVRAPRAIIEAARDARRR